MFWKQPRALGKKNKSLWVFYMITPYIKWLITCFWLPTLILVFVLGKRLVKKYHRAYFLATAGGIIIGFLWDFYAINLDIWHYPVGGTMGFNVLSLPAEEWLFLFTVPSFIVSGYLLFLKITKKIDDSE